MTGITVQATSKKELWVVFEGLGLALELNLNTMFTGSNETNIASIKSNLNAGMKKEGVSREAIYINGKYYNQINFAITKKDFLKKRK